MSTNDREIEDSNYGSCDSAFRCYFPFENIVPILYNFIMKRVAFLFVFLFISFQTYGRCFQIIQKHEKDDRDFKSLCSIAGFSEANIEYIIEFLKDPFVVKKVFGRILRTDGVPMPGVLLEIREKDINWNSHRIYKAYADKNGFFRFKHIKQGIYCFKTTLDGWQSVMGEIIVSDKAKGNSNILIEIGPGV
jgi:hypothetical protein